MSCEIERNLATVDRYMAAIERGALGAELAEFFAPDVVQQEFPSRVAPRGAVRGLDGLLAGAERGQQLLAKQRYEIKNRVASGNHVALEILWVGTLATPLGTLAAGAEPARHLGVFLELEDDKIKSQRNYDCYEPW